MHERDLLVGREALERHAPRPRATERLQHPQRTIREHPIGREQIDVDIVLHHRRAQQQARLERHARPIPVRPDR